MCQVLLNSWKPGLSNLFGAADAGCFGIVLLGSVNFDALSPKP